MSAEAAKLEQEVAKAVVIDSRRMAALILRLSAEERALRGIDEWHIPGGSREETDDSLEATARREFEEETGIDGSRLRLLGELGGAEWDALYEGQEAHFTASFLAFVLEYEDGDLPQVMIGSESSGAAWITKEQAADYPHLTPQGRQFIPAAFSILEARNGQ